MVQEYSPQAHMSYSNHDLKLPPVGTGASTAGTTCSTVRRGRWCTTWPPSPSSTTGCSTARGFTLGTTMTSSASPFTRSKTSWPRHRYARPIGAQHVAERPPEAFLISRSCVQVGRDPAIHVWDIQTLKCLSLLKGYHSRGVCALEFTGNRAPHL